MKFCCRQHSGEVRLEMFHVWCTTRLSDETSALTNNHLLVGQHQQVAPSSPGPSARPGSAPNHAPSGVQVIQAASRAHRRPIACEPCGCWALPLGGTGGECRGRGAGTIQGVRVGVAVLGARVSLAVGLDDRAGGSVVGSDGPSLLGAARAGSASPLDARHGTRAQARARRFPRVLAVLMGDHRDGSACSAGVVLLRLCTNLHIAFFVKKKKTYTSLSHYFFL